MAGTITTNRNQNLTGSNQYKKECSYILQDDRLIPLFTVQETMNMAADLKLGKSLTPKAKQFLIDDILDTLGLTMQKDTRCACLSGGQKKRVSIALELIDNPPIMFLDEPTTGLDSSSSTQCIKMLKALARGGRTIVCTIHQPSASLYELFDHVYVLADGYCIYQGASTNTVQYLSSVGLRCPQYHNPADYLLEVANGDYGNFNEILSQTAKSESWRNKRTTLLLNESICDTENTEKNGNVVKENEQKALVLVSTPSEWTRFGILLNRTLTQIYRDWTVTHIKFVLHIFVGILLGVYYLNTGNDGSKTFRNVGYCIVTLVYLSYTSMMPAVLTYPQELPVLKKERFNNWYCLKTYYIAYLIVDVPLQILLCSAHVGLSYVMTAQPLEPYRILTFLLACVMVTLTSESFGIFLGTVVNPINGTFFGAIYTAVMLVLAGFLILFSHMSNVFLWLSQFSYLRHGIQSLLSAIYTDRGPLPCPEDVIYCHFRSPQKLLDDFDMPTSGYWFSLLILMVYFILCRVLAYFTLKRRLKHT